MLSCCRDTLGRDGAFGIVLLLAGLVLDSGTALAGGVITEGKLFEVIAVATEQPDEDDGNSDSGTSDPGDGDEVVDPSDSSSSGTSTGGTDPTAEQVYLWSSMIFYGHDAASDPEAPDAVLGRDVYGAALAGSCSSMPKQNGAGAMGAVVLLGALLHGARLLAARRRRYTETTL